MCSSRPGNAPVATSTARRCSTGLPGAARRGRSWLRASRPRASSPRTRGGFARASRARCRAARQPPGSRKGLAARGGPCRRRRRAAGADAREEHSGCRPDDRAWSASRTPGSASKMTGRSGVQVAHSGPHAVPARTGRTWPQTCAPGPALLAGPAPRLAGRLGDLSKVRTARRSQQVISFIGRQLAHSGPSGPGR